MGSIAPYGVQKYFSTILWSQDMSKTIWGPGPDFKDLKKMNNLISWNPIPPQYIHNFFLILEGCNTFHYKSDFLPHVSSSKSNLFNIREPKYKENNMRHQISGHKIVQSLKFSILISHFDFLISRLPDGVQKWFCTSGGSMDLTFQMKYVPPF